MVHALELRRRSEVSSKRGGPRVESDMSYRIASGMMTNLLGESESGRRGAHGTGAKSTCGMWIALAVGSVVCLVDCGPARSYEAKSGDIIFQTSRSAQSVAIQRATGSPYSHMGIVYVEAGQPFVFEAVETVKSTPLERWIARGEGRSYVVKRLKDAEKMQTAEFLEGMRREAAQFKGKPYDLYFGWSDERLYCSELSWKIYKRALDIELGALERLSDFDLSDPEVRKKVRERWGDSPPLDERVISPVTIFESDLLITVHEE
jgi:hypothetical protein